MTTMHLAPHANARRAPRPTRLQLALCAAWLCGPVLAWGQTLPSGMQVVHGQAQLAVQGAQMTVRNSPGAVLDWRSFSVGAGHGVYFDQANAASKVLNRVIGNDPSQILGTVASNGQVWLLNPHGVLFGRDARVDVGSLVVSTLRLNDHDFLAGRYRFAAPDGAAAPLRNEGSLRSSFGGQIALLGAGPVENAGRIEAPGGSIALASARSVELVDTGLPNLAVRVDVPAGTALNLGSLVAAGGAIDVHAAIVNQQGLVRADSVGRDAAGRVVLRAAERLTLADASETAAPGGRIALLGREVGVLDGARVDASAANGGGAINIGGGRGGQDPTLPNADAVYVGPRASIAADALERGDGGTIVLWSDRATRAYGSFSARGGPLGGDGGFLETSGGWLDARPAALSLGAARGSAGLWLLDPNDIAIRDAGPDTNIGGGPNFTSTGDGSVISTGTIAAALNAGNSVTVATGTGGANSQAGDIDAVMNLAVAPPSAVTLRLQAHRDILVDNSSIVSTGAPLSVELAAAAGGVGAIAITGTQITTAGGDVSLGGVQSQQLPIPGIGFTAELYKPAVGFVPSGGDLPRIDNGNPFVGGIALHQASFDLGSGRFTAVGMGPQGGVDVAGGVSVVARSIEIVGSGTAANGVEIAGFLNQSPTLTATESLVVKGYGQARGLLISAGARLTLDAAANPNAQFQLTGYGAGDNGLLLSDDLVNGYRQTQIVVRGGNVEISGLSLTAAPGVDLSAGASGLPLATVDFAGAASASIQASSQSGTDLWMHGLRIDGPSNGSFSTTAAMRQTTLERLDYNGGGSVGFNGAGFHVADSRLQSTGAALDIAFNSNAAGGLMLRDSTLQSGGGNVALGGSRQVCSALLACETGHWLDGSLTIQRTSIDAGSGAIVGGGALSTGSGTGLFIDSGTLAARDVALAGRTEVGHGAEIRGRSSLTAAHELRLTGSAGSGQGNGGLGGLLVLDGSRLSVLNHGGATDAAMVLSGRNVSATGGHGLQIAGTAPDNGTTGPTVLTVQDASLSLTGSASDFGIMLRGNLGPQSGGVRIDATAAGTHSVSIDGTASNPAGRGFYGVGTKIAGPSGGGGAEVLLRSSGGTYTFLNSSEITGGSPVRYLSDRALYLSGTQINVQGGIELSADASAFNGSALWVLNSQLTSTGSGDQIRLHGPAGGAAAAGPGVFAGIDVNSSTISAPGGAVFMHGAGGVSGSNGIDLKGATLTGDQISLQGAAVVDGHGIFAQVYNSTGTTIATRNLTLAGQGADSTATPTHVGVLVDAQTSIQLSGRGNAMISGDSVVVRDAQIGGNAASLAISTTGAQLLSNSVLDFAAGAGTNLALTADSDGNLSGRARLEFSTVKTGGGFLNISGVGMSEVDLQGNALARNFTVKEGGSGLLLAATAIDAGAGNVTLDGRGVTIGRTPAPNESGTWGIFASGASSVRGGAITLNGMGGDHGTGIDIGIGEAGARLDLDASSIAVIARGSGLQPDAAPGARLYPGLQLDSTSRWTASGDISVTSQSGGLSLAGGAQLGAGAALNLNSAELIRLDAVQLTGGSLLARSGGTVDPLLPAIGIAHSQLATTAGELRIGMNGAAAAQSTPGLQIVESGLNAPGQPITLDGRGAIAGVSLEGAVLGAARINVSGSAVGSGYGLIADSSNALSTVLTAADLSLTGRSAGGPNDVGLAFVDATQLNLSGHGQAVLGGDTVLLDQFKASGDVAQFRVASDAALSIYGSTLDFRAGAGSAVQLQAGQSNLAGRPALEIGNSSIATGGDITLGAAEGMAVRSTGLHTPGLLLEQAMLTASGTIAARGDSASGNGIEIRSSSVAGRAIELAGHTDVDAGGPFTGVYADAASLSANEQLKISGAGGLFAGIVLDVGTALRGKSVWLSATSGGAGLDLDAANLGQLSASVAGMTGNDYLTLQLSGPGTLTFDGAFMPAPHLLLLADRVTLAAGARIGSLAQGDALELAGSSAGAIATFANQAGAGALQTPNGRWLARFADPRQTDLGGLDYGFTRLDAGAFVEQRDQQGNLITPAPGNGVFYMATPADLGLGAVRGLLTRGYDASLNLTLDPQTWQVDGLLAGHNLTPSGSPAAHLIDKNAGLGKVVVVEPGSRFEVLDAGGKPVFGYAAPTFTANIAPALLVAQNVAAADKTYDGTTSAQVTGTLGGLFAGDSVVASWSGQFADRHAGVGKPVDYQLQLGGTDVANYRLSQSSGFAAATIRPATLTYLADPLTLPTGVALPPLQGGVTGFVGGDTLETATSGTPRWTSTVGPASEPGRYAIEGSGLTASDYQFVQAPGNATALTLTATPRVDVVTAATRAGTETALLSVAVPMMMSTPTESRVLDAMPAFQFDGSAAAPLAFRSVNLSQMSRAEMQTLLAARDSYKKKLFSDTLFKLEQDPALADVRPCRSEAELDRGDCLLSEALKREIVAAREAERARAASAATAATAAAAPRGAAAKRKVKQATLPTIERKFALLIGINQYADKRIPELKSAVPDAIAVSGLLEESLGYDTLVVENPTKEQVIRALNRLALEIGGNDSVMIYFAGHGEVVPATGMGYWLPSDSRADGPESWLSNADIARLIAAIGARQLMLVSDSCYSGTLAGREKVSVDQRSDAGLLLSRRAAIVMSSGGNEPVSDEGKNGHSIFAWHLMQRLKDVSAWQVGGNVFERLRYAVAREFPQTPQYGASRSAGHEGNTDYLFEKRELEKR